MIARSFQYFQTNGFPSGCELSSSEVPQTTFNKKELRSLVAKDVEASLMTRSGFENLHIVGEKSETSIKVRNKIHARKTRLRRKVYIERLASYVETLEMETSKVHKQISESQQTRNRQRLFRLEIIDLFFHYWNACITDIARWNHAVEDEVMVTIPHINNHSEKQLKGPWEIVQYCTSIAMSFESLTLKSINRWDDFFQQDRQCRLNFKPKKSHYLHSLSEEILSPIMVLPFDIMIIISSEMTRGESKEIVHSSGILRCSFSSLNKISFLEILFDVRGIHQELEQHGYNLEDLVVPDTLEAAQSLIQKGFTKSDNDTLSSEDVRSKFLVRVSQSFEILDFATQDNTTKLPSTNNKALTIFDVILCVREMKIAMSSLLDDVSLGRCGSRFVVVSSLPDQLMSNMSPLSLQKLKILYIKAFPLRSQEKVGPCFLMDVENVPFSLEALATISSRCMYCRGPLLSYYTSKQLSVLVRDAISCESRLML